MTLAPAAPFGNVPPQNLEAEESVIGAMLISPNAIDAVSEVLAAGDFYRESHSRIYRAALALHTDGRPVDAITVADELDLRGELDGVGGRVRVHELAALVPASANAAHHARIVRDMAILRGLIRVGGEIARLGWERPDEVPRLVEQGEQIMFDLSQQRSTHDLIPVADAMRPVWNRIVERAESGRAIVGVATGYGPLDELTSGFQPGNLIVVAGRPSMGKSALALCIADHIAVHQNLPVALFTLEMSEGEVVERLISAEAFVDSQRIRNGNLTPEDWQAITVAAGKIERAPLWIDDSGLITMAEIRSKARRMKARNPNLALVVVDYLQLMTAGVPTEGRVQEVSQISRSLKVLAGELRVPVIALSQLSRQVEQRHDKRPILSDLRDSGSIEQDADLVLFVYRDEYYNPENADELGTAGIAEVNLAKQRNGPTGTIKLAFVKKFARFSELPPPGTADYV